MIKLFKLNGWIILKTLIKQIKSKPVMTTFLMLCLIITCLAVSIISSIIDRQELLKREENIGFSYNTLSQIFIAPTNGFNKPGEPAKSLKNLEKNEYYQKYESCLITSFQKDKLTVPIAVVKVNFNYFDKLSVLKVLDTSDMKNSVAIGVKLYDQLGKPKTIRIFNREYKISHILGSNMDSTAFDQFIVLNYKILSSQDKEAFTIGGSSGLVNIIKFFNTNNSDSLNSKIVISFTGPHNECAVGKTDFDAGLTTVEGTQAELKEAYDKQISNKNFLIIIGICNIVIVSAFWIVDRTKEIAIRKAFGANKMQISLMIFKELLILSIFASLIAIILQYIFMPIAGKYFDFAGTPSPKNIVLVSIAAFIVTIISTVIPVRNALHMEISECLKD